MACGLGLWSYVLRICSYAAGVIPMFPHSVAGGCFSLRTSAGTVPAMSISATVAEDGALLDYDIMPTLIVPNDRLTYIEV